jgi:hypothetical protein
MKSAKAKALGLGGALLVAVYVPAFIAAALVRPRIELAIALIMAISLLIAILLIFLFARGAERFRRVRVSHTQLAICRNCVCLRADARACCCLAESSISVETAV